MTGTPIYLRWRNMRQRCTRESHPQWHRYGGRGIKVCPEWDTSFIAFWSWAEANGFHPDLELDRIDNDGNYEPTNCRWATKSVNGRNKEASRLITAFGETKHLLEWLDDPRTMVGLPTVEGRLRGGWTPEEALSTKPHGRRRKYEPKEACDHGHPMTEENTVFEKRGRWTIRTCKTCRRERGRRYWARKKSKET